MQWHTVIATSVAVFSGMSVDATRAAAIELVPADQATSCEIPDQDFIGFPCGVPHLGPGQTAGGIELPSSIQNSAIEFPLADVSGVRRAELRLTARAFSPYPEFVNDPVLEVHGYVGDGIVQYDDVNTQNLIYTSVPIAELGLYAFDVTDFVSRQSEDGAAYVGFAIRDIVQNSHVSFGDSTRLYIDAQHVPEPTTLAPVFLFSALRLRVAHRGRTLRSSMRERRRC
jgi:hypothetical protein